MSKQSYSRRGALALGLLLTAVLLLLLAPTASATEIRGGDTVVISAGETVNDDLYLAGNRIVIDGVVNGDLIAGAAEVVINGEVTGDLLAGASMIMINGRVGDDVRAAGALLQLGPEAQVGDEIMNTGSALVLERGSQVGGDVNFFGGQATIDGAIGGDLRSSSAGLTFNGSVAGDLDATVGSADSQFAFNPMQFMPNAPAMPPTVPGLQVGPDAEIGGSVNLDVPDPATAAAVPDDFEATVTVSPTTTDEPAPNPFLDYLSEFAGRFLVLFLAGAAIVWLLPGLLRDSAARLAAEPWASLGWGALLYFLVPLLLFAVGLGVGLLALLLGLIGLGGVGGTLFFYTLLVLAAAMLLFAVVLGLLAKVVAGYAIGRALLRGRAQDGPWLPLVVGVLIVALLAALPFVGWLANWLFSAFGLGALWLAWRGRGTAVAAPVAPLEKAPL